MHEGPPPRWGGGPRGGAWDQALVSSESSAVAGSGGAASAAAPGGGAPAVAAAAGTGYLVAAYSWNVAFSVLGALGLIAALLFSRIDASKRVYSDPEPDETRGFAT